ncbi:MAG: 50S ribosomal protein L15 [Candidatus Zixiibacteriota bacterium]|nr:MAG: 50S ribosomal protein L15 [candidate division Zixibacteria bacterium]
MFDLSSLKPSRGSVKNRKRLGRGAGSGTGKTSGKGHKGQKSRSGYKSKPWNEGGQMPLQRRLPKRGFTNIFRTEYQEVAVSRLAVLGIDDITPEVLLKERAVSRKGIPVKILGNGEIDKAVRVKAHAFSKSAVEKIEKAGGKIEIIGKNEEKKKNGASESGGGEDGGEKS